MRFECKELGFHFEMNDNNFISLNEQGKIKFFNFTEQQLKQNLFVFMETKDDKFTGRYFQMTLDGGRYPTAEDVKNGQDNCIANVKRAVPDLRLLSETTIMPNNIRSCLWKRTDGSLFSQYYMAKNGYMFCVAGDVSRAHDDLDNLMAFVCMSVTGENQQDLEREKQQKIMQALTREANLLVDLKGLSIDVAMEKARKKFGVNLHAEQKELDLESEINISLPKDFKRLLSLPGDPVFSETYGKENQNASCFVIVYPIGNQNAMPFGNETAVIDGIHKNLSDTQGLIEVKSGALHNGKRYIYRIVKSKLTPSGVQYALNMHIDDDSVDKNTCLCVEAIFNEKGTTGQRDSFILNKMMNDGKISLPDMTGWTADPYDKNYRQGLLMNLSEDEKYDDLFPEHPLSEMRKLIKFVIENN